MALKLKDPFLGSGKITRRLKQEHLSLIQSGFVALRKVRERGAKKPVQQGFPQLTTSYRKIFNTWNSKGPPFTKHNTDRMSKTHRSNLRAIRKHIEQYSIEAICQAIDDCHALFRNKFFVYGHYGKAAGIARMCLHNFFEYSDEVREHVLRVYNPDLLKIHSWFKESLNGFDYLMKKYSSFEQSRCPEIYVRIKEIWSAHVFKDSFAEDRAKDDGEFTIEELSIMARISNMIFDFSQALSGDTDLVTDRIEYLLRDKMIKPRHVGYFRSDYWWFRVLPKELNRYDPNHIKIDDAIQAARQMFSLTKKQND